MAWEHLVVSGRILLLDEAQGWEDTYQQSDDSGGVYAKRNCWSVDDNVFEIAHPSRTVEQDNDRKPWDEGTTLHKFVWYRAKEKLGTNFWYE